MKKTRRKNIFRSIRGSLNRFLSILFIVALGAGFMAGLAATSPDMYETGDHYMDEYNWYDIDVKSPYGFAESDADRIEELDKIETVMPAVVFDMVLEGRENVSYTSRVYGILDENNGTPLNGFKLTEGRMPENSSECLVQSIAKYTGKQASLGEKLVLSREDTDYESLSGYMTNEELTIVGLVEGPMCISIIGENTTAGSGSISLYVYTRKDVYDTDFFTDIYLSVAGAREMDCFSDEYKSLINSVRDAIEDISEEASATRTEQLRGEAREELDKAKNFLESAKALADSERELAHSAAVGAVMNSQIAQLFAADPNFAALLGDVSSKTMERLEELSDSTGNGSEAAGFDSLEEEIRKAEEALDNISDGFWLARTREDSAGFDSYESNVGKVGALAKIFPVFFFVVALLVALTTMTRLIEENRGQIGTLRGLGFTNIQILSEYMAYSFSASVLGCLVGFAIGFRVFPLAISSAYGMMFFLPATLTPIRPDIVAWVAPVTVVSIILATFWACYDEFRACPAELMVPKAPAAGKRIWLERIPFVWKHISFTYKVTFRNLFRYKKRFIMTIIGVAGCTALLLTGFGVRDSVNDIVDKQFGELYRYELTLAVDDEASITEDEILSAFLNDRSKIDKYMAYNQQSCKIIGSNGTESATLVVPENADRNSDFISLRSRKSGESLPYAGAGELVLTEKLCEQLSLKPGDRVTLENADGKRAAFTLSGITENYVTSFAYIRPESYLEAFGEEADYTIVFCVLGAGADNDTITTAALESSHVLYANSSVTLKETFADSIKSINGVVWVLIFAAGLLSIVVLYNLNNVNICERRKELATIQVLGFYRRETENYVSRESNILSLLGALAGLLLGIWLHSVVVRTVEVEQVMFGRNIYPLSFLYAIGITMVFSLLVNLIMKRTIKAIDMVEAMKAND